MIGGIQVTKQNITAWFLEGGSVSIPKHLITFMEPLGLSFEDLGKMVYLLYCGTDQIKRGDHYAQEAARALHQKGLIHWFTDNETIDFSPMFDKISAYVGETPQYKKADKDDVPASKLSYAQMIKNIEKKFGHAVPAADIYNMQEVVQLYSWPYELVQELYFVYYAYNFIIENNPCFQYMELRVIFYEYFYLLSQFITDNIRQTDTSFANGEHTAEIIVYASCKDGAENNP